MYGVWIIPFAILIVFIAAELITKGNIGDRGLAIKGFILALVTFVVLMFTSILDMEFDTTPVKDTEVDIIALKDLSGANGKNYVGTGNNGGGHFYYYMTEFDKGARMSSVGIEEAYIKEVTLGTKATLVTYKLRRDSGIARFIYGDYMRGKEYIFTVPEGTVTTDFTVDME